VGGGTGVSDHRAHTEWQLTLSGVQSIMMEKLAQAGKGGGSRPPPFKLLLRTKLQCMLQLSGTGQIHSHCFISTNILYVLCVSDFVMSLA
jgi:hypothetical protein